jgi:hypothetical protein
MAHDSPDSQQPPPRAANRLMLFAGVAGACALGVGAGLWARPADSERDPHAMHVAKAAAPEKPAGKLEIVVDDSPAPIGKPIEVLPAAAAEVPRPSFILPPAPVEPEPIVPSRPPEGLVRVQAVAPPAPQVDPAAVKLASERLAERAAKAEQARLEKVRAEKAEKVRLEKVRLERTRLEKVRADKAEKARAEKLRLEKVKLQRATVDRAERAKIERQARAEARAELLAEQKTAKARQAKLAKAKAAKAEAAELAAAKRSALNKLAHALSRAVHHDKAIEASAKKKAVPVRGEGPLRLASYKQGGRCVSADPGAAIVCADPALASADKRLARAYQEAEAAGVSPAQLKRQQDRWLAARSAAAREAPWAVHDVYLARIAELNDQARDARGGGY